MKYTKQAITEKLDDLIYGDTRESNRRMNFLKQFVLFLFLFCVLCTGAFGIGMFKGIIDNAPALSDISFSPQGFASKTYDTEGNLTATLVQEGSNREEASFEEIPENLINAFVAVEDKRFWEHNGIDLVSISRAVKGVLTHTDLGGGSTITQQLIKNNVFDGGMESGFALYERKFQEWYVALMLENQPDVNKLELKKQIMTDYLNTINLGNNTLGVKVAARRYFNKEVSDLNLSECTVLAAITKNPTRLNPITHPEDNAERRKLFLDEMLAQNYITQEEYDEAISDNVYARIAAVNELQEAKGSEVYSWFTDALIPQAIKIFKERLSLTEKEARDLLYSGGLRIETTQDPRIQEIVDREVNDPDNYDTAKYSFTWRFSVKHADGTMTHYSEHDIENYCKNVKGQRYDGLFRTEEKLQETIDEFKSTVMTEGDEAAAETLDTTLEPQTSMVIIDQKTKAVRALSGGRGQKKYNLAFNRVTDMRRQPGSTFKVVSSFAPAIDEYGATLATTYYDSEYSIGEKQFKNWWRDGEYFGYSSIREGIEFSMNIVAVRCMMETVTPEGGIDYARNLGISTLVDEDKNGASALGGLTWGVTNLDLTNAFATIADGGIYGEPLFFTKVYSHDGTLLLDLSEDEGDRVMKEATAFLLTDAMQQSMILQYKWASGYTVNVTSTRAHLDNMSAAGKSGTTTNNVDVWFVGYTPYYTAGIWAGCDDNQSLYDSKTGAYNGGTSFHKDIWRKVMTQVSEGQENVPFEQPDSIVKVTVCRKSGKLPGPGCKYDGRGSAIYEEYFDVDNVPTETCEIHTSGGRIVLPKGEEDKYTDDSSFASNGRARRSSSGSGSGSGSSSRRTGGSSGSSSAGQAPAGGAPADPGAGSGSENTGGEAQAPAPAEQPNVIYQGSTNQTEEVGPGVGL
ncbi:MAG: transglycosylase domain-containing protein [Eubacteriales bacterium]|nr:transglycosylase domain-containing protein [Eubacteriales bacterium]